MPAPIWGRFEVVIEGRVASKTPADCECFRECSLLPPPGLAEYGVRGEGFRDDGSWFAATDLAAAVERDGVGREKFCRLVVLELGCDVKLTIGVPPCCGCGYCCCCCCCIVGLLDFATFKGRIDGRGGGESAAEVEFEFELPC